MGTQTSREDALRARDVSVSCVAAENKGRRTRPKAQSVTTPISRLSCPYPADILETHPPRPSVPAPRSESRVRVTLQNEWEWEAETLVYEGANRNKLLWQVRVRERERPHGETRPAAVLAVASKTVPLVFSPR